MNTDNRNVLQQMELIKQCLSDYNYPFYSTLNDDEKIEIVSVKNFPNLIKWLLKTIDNQYEKLLVELTKDELSDVIYQQGFCTSKQNIKFMNGELPPQETVEILHRMFNYLKHYKDSTSPNNYDGNINANIDIDVYLTDLKAINTQLLAGDKRTFTTEEIQMKLDEYRDKIDQFEQITANDQISHITEYPIKYVNELLDDIKSNLKIFKIKTANLLWRKIDDQTPFSSNYHNLGDEFHAKLVDLMGFLHDTDTIFNRNSNNSIDCCNVNLELVKEKLLMLNNLIEDFDVPNDNSG